MRRPAVLVALVVLLIAVAAMLLFLTSAPDDVASPAPSRAPVREVERPARGDRGVRSRDAAVAEVPAEVPPATPPEADPPRSGTGRLRCEVVAPDDAKRGPALVAKLTVIWPTGEAITSHAVPAGATFEFRDLPHRSPLALRVEGAGILTGYCCDIRIDEGRTVTRRIELLAAVTASVQVTDPRSRGGVAGVTASVVSPRGDVASSVTDAKGLTTIVVPDCGPVRVRLRFGEDGAPRELAATVRPDGVAGTITLPPPGGGALEVLVLEASGAPARAVRVWLAGEWSPRPAAVSGDAGIARFLGVDPSNRLTILARTPDQGFAVAALEPFRRDPAPVRLVLRAPVPFAGDVVDEANRVVTGAAVTVVLRPYGDEIRAVTDDTGRFAFEPLAGGFADLTVRAAGFEDWRPPAPVPVHDAGGAPYRVRLRRAPTGSVFVRVADERGAPLSGAAVRLERSRRDATTDASGTCRIDGVPVGLAEPVSVSKDGWQIAAASPVRSPIAEVVADRTIGVDVTLAPIRAAPPAAGVGTSSVFGRVLDPEGLPVMGVTVVCCGVRAATDSRGSFSLERLAPAASPHATELSILPGPGVLLPFSATIELTPAGARDFGDVRLRMRPFAVVRLPEPPPTYGDPRRPDRATRAGQGKFPPSSAAFLFASNHADQFAAVQHAPLQGFACVSYDGTWFHLPSMDTAIADGRCETFVGFPTGRGIESATAVCTLRLDAWESLVMRLPTPSGDAVTIDSRAVGPAAVLEQVACERVFEPRRTVLATGQAEPAVDPFAAFADLRRVAVDDRSARSLDRLVGLARGRWRVTGRGGAAAEFTVPGAQFVGPK